MGYRMFLITYQLTPFHSAKLIADEIQKSFKWWHYIDETWLVVTAEDATQLYNRVAPNINVNERLLIVEIKRWTTYQGWLPEEAWTWIRENLAHAWS